MKGFPVWRVPPGREGRIGLGLILLAYLVAVLLVPALGWLLYSGLLEDCGDACLGGGPVADALAFAFAGVLGMMFSPLYSWIGVGLSLPLVLLCQSRGLMGWGAAIGAGVLVTLVSLQVLGFVFGGRVDGGVMGLHALGLPSGVLISVLFWLALRVMRPSAFRDDLP